MWSKKSPCGGSIRKEPCKGWRCEVRDAAGDEAQIRRRTIHMTGTIDPALFGMPNATNTGVPAGTTLTAYTGPMTITTPGTVIEGLIINGQLAVNAANVTIKDCLIQNYGYWGIDA